MLQKEKKKKSSICETQLYFVLELNYVDPQCKEKIEKFWGFLLQLRNHLQLTQNYLTMSVIVQKIFFYLW